MTSAGLNLYEPHWKHENGYKVLGFQFTDRGEKGVRMASYSKMLSGWRKLAHYFLCNISPTKNCNEIRSLDLYVLSKLDGPQMYNLPMVIEGEMRRFLWDVKVRAFPFPILVSKILEHKLQGQLDFGEYVKVEAKPGNVKDDKNLHYIDPYHHPNTRQWMTKYWMDLKEVPTNNRNKWKIHPSQRRPRVPVAPRGEEARRQ